MWMLVPSGGHSLVVASRFDRGAVGLANEATAGGARSAAPARPVCDDFVGNAEHGRRLTGCPRVCPPPPERAASHRPPGAMPAHRRQSRHGDGAYGISSEGLGRGACRAS